MKGAGESQQLTGVRWWTKHILRLLRRHSHTDCLLQETRVHWYRRHLPKLGLARLGIIRHTRLEGGRKEGRARKGRRTSVGILSHFSTTHRQDRITFPIKQQTSKTHLQ